LKRAPAPNQGREGGGRKLSPDEQVVFHKSGFLRSEEYHHC